MIYNTKSMFYLDLKLTNNMSTIFITPPPHKLTLHVTQKR